MPKHYVEVRVDENHLERLSKLRPITEEDRKNAYSSWLICSDPANCPGWQECREPHEVDGVSAAEGPDWCPEFDGEGEECIGPWCGMEDFVFHGKIHTWQDGYGWTVDFEDCPVQEHYVETPDGIPMDREGLYDVDIDWDWDHLEITLIGESDKVTE